MFYETQFNRKLLVTVQIYFTMYESSDRGNLQFLKMSVLSIEPFFKLIKTKM